MKKGDKVDSKAHFEPFWSILCNAAKYGVMLLGRVCSKVWSQRVRSMKAWRVLRLFRKLYLKVGIMLFDLRYVPKFILLGII